MWRFLLELFASSGSKKPLKYLLHFFPFISVANFRDFEGPQSGQNCQFESISSLFWQKIDKVRDFEQDWVGNTAYYHHRNWYMHVQFVHGGTYVMGIIFKISYDIVSDWKKNYDNHGFSCSSFRKKRENTTRISLHWKSFTTLKGKWNKRKDFHFGEPNLGKSCFILHVQNKEEKALCMYSVKAKSYIL